MSESRAKSPVVPLVIAAVAAIVLLVGLLGSLGRSDGDQPTTPEAEDTAATATATKPADATSTAPLARRLPDDPMALGEVDAPVVLIAYSEFQCPFCGKFSRDTAPVLIEKYVEDGTLRIEWRDFPYLGPESTTAAIGARAAAAQGRFWEFHDALYADQLPPNSGNLDEDYVAGIAKQIGLDVERFRADFADPVTRQLVEQDFQEGQAIGVTGTPSFLINDTPVVGAQPVSVFERAIEEAARS